MTISEESLNWCLEKFKSDSNDSMLIREDGLEPNLAVMILAVVIVYTDLRIIIIILLIVG